MIFYTENLVSEVLQSGIMPWEFKPTERLTDLIRYSKSDRQKWYQLLSTKHYFYTGIEPVNPNLRVNKKENPPIQIHAFVADYDVPVPDSRIHEAVAALKIKPTWVEKSLGGNFRLVWLLSAPFRTADHDFTVFILGQAEKWLHLGILPGLDAAAFITATRLYCNGCEWFETGAGAISVTEAQAFFVECGRKFRFSSAANDTLPLDVVEKAVREKYPNLTWPGPFELDSQGPSFWIPGSTSPNSAIIKAGGIFSFAAHAVTPFSSWADILGAEFIKDFKTGAIAKATLNIYYDGQNYWQLKEGVYKPLSKDDLLLYFKVDCRLTSKPGSEGVSQIDIARQHIHNHAYVSSAAPFIFRPPGPTTFQGERRLNIYLGSPLLSNSNSSVWGDGFEFIAQHFDALFDREGETKEFEQRNHFLAWFKHFYSAAVNWTPAPGVNNVFSGGVGIGKTFTSRAIVGAAVGGFADASDYLLNGSQFNAHLMSKPLWCLDDDTPSGDARLRMRVGQLFKKMAANQQFSYNEKFQKGGMLEWMGRIFITTNLDFSSVRVVGPMDISALDKLNLFKCVVEPRFTFPPRHEVEKKLSIEMPNFLGFLLRWNPPEYVLRDNRYGYKSFHHPFILDRVHQGSPVATFKELMIRALEMYFLGVPDAASYSATATDVHKLLIMDPTNAQIMRAYKPEQVNRYLEQLQSEKLLACSASTGPYKTRIWTFPRSANPSAPVTSSEIMVCSPEDLARPNPFVKNANPS